MSLAETPKRPELSPREIGEAVDNKINNLIEGLLSYPEVKDKIARDRFEKRPLIEFDINERPYSLNYIVSDYDVNTREVHFILGRKSGKFLDTLNLHTKYQKGVEGKSYLQGEVFLSTDDETYRDERALERMDSIFPELKPPKTN